MSETWLEESVVDNLYQMTTLWDFRCWFSSHSVFWLNTLPASSCHQINFPLKGESIINQQSADFSDASTKWEIGLRKRKRLLATKLCKSWNSSRNNSKQIMLLRGLQVPSFVSRIKNNVAFHEIRLISYFYYFCQFVVLYKIFKFTSPIWFPESIYYVVK